MIRHDDQMLIGHARPNDGVYLVLFESYYLPNPIPIRQQCGFKPHRTI